VIRRALNLALVLVGVLVLAGGIVMRLNDVQLDPVLSGSMRPLAQPGDMAITTGVPTSALRVGDVIVIVPPGDRQPVMHRIASLAVDPAGHVSVTTKGDANNVADAWGSVVLTGAESRRLAFVVPLIGWLPQERGWLLVAAGLLVGTYVLRTLVRQRKEPGLTAA